MSPDLTVDLAPALAAAVENGCICKPPLVVIELTTTPPTVRLMHTFGAHCPCASAPTVTRQANADRRRTRP